MLVAPSTFSFAFNVAQRCGLRQHALKTLLVPAFFEPQRLWGEDAEVCSIDLDDEDFLLPAGYRDGRSRWSDNRQHPEHAPSVHPGCMHGTHGTQARHPEHPGTRLECRPCDMLSLLPSAALLRQISRLSPLAAALPYHTGSTISPT